MPHPITSDRRIDYIEFFARDIPATKAFYEKVFGWKFTDYGPDYTSFEDGRIAGGFRTDVASGPATASCLVVMFAADLEAVKAAVQGAGAKVFNEHTFPGGRRFHFHDPNGNELAVWSDR